jgi:putative membrane protein
MRFIVTILVIAIALWASTFLPGITVGPASPAGTATTLVMVAILFGVVNAVLKPYIRAVGRPLYAMTYGLFALVVNALLYWLTSWLAGVIGLPFHVSGFWPAVWGALVVAIVGLNIDRLLQA